MKSIRNFLARFLLRGPILRLWLRVISSRLAAEYGAFLLLSRPRRGAPVKPRPQPIKRALFLCANMWEQRELLPELQKICEVEFIDVTPFRINGKSESESSLDLDRLLPRLAGARFDVSIVYLNGALLSDQLIQTVRHGTAGPVFGLNLDDKTSYATYSVFRKSPQNYRRWADRFDYNLTNSRAILDVYRDDGFPCLYFPTGFHYDPEIHRFDPAVQHEYELTFVGSCKPERQIFIEELQRRGIPVKLFGGGWKNATFVNDGWNIFRKSQINLGIGYNLPDTQFTNLKNRDFECPGSGGCYLTTYDWELAELFEVGKEILCYRNVYDFIEVYAHYRRRPEKCLEIARAGYLRSISEHTWAHRFKAVFDEVGLRYDR